jgi:GxxExxY protein
VLDAAFQVHSALGPGLLESVYEVASSYELLEAGHKVQNQVVLPILYCKIEIPSGLRLGM